MEQGQGISATALTDREKVEWMLSLPKWEHRINRNGYILLVKPYHIDKLSDKEVASLAKSYDFVRNSEDRKNNGVLLRG